MATLEQKAPSVASGAKARVYKNFINGEWVESHTGHTFENLNPADTREVVGIFQKSDKQDVDTAIEAAKQAYKKWRLVPAPRRAEMLYKASEILIARKEEYSQLMTREMGKVIKETRGDVQEAIDCGYYTAGEGRRLFGPTVPSELPNKFAMAVRQPLGVCAMITPWNFPMAIPSWKLFPALVAGQHRRDQAGAGHSALDVEFCAGADRWRDSGGRGQHRHRLRRAKWARRWSSIPRCARFR